MQIEWVFFSLLAGLFGAALTHYLIAKVIGPLFGHIKNLEQKENAMNIKKIFIILVHAFIGWALCGAIMFIGMSVMDMQTTLIIHAIGAPIIFTIISLVYFNKFNYTPPLQTALIFVSFVIAMDFFVVALMVEKSLEMFASPIGTWIPFALIFTSTYVTGLLTARSFNQQAVT